MTAAKRLHATETNLFAGRVSLVETARICVSLEETGREVLARRAASCLLAPQPGDRVLVALFPDAFVVSVLERRDAGRAEMTFEGDVAIRASGRLDLTSASGVGITTPRRATLTSEELEIRARHGNLVFNTLSALASAATVHFVSLGAIVDACSLSAQTIHQRLRRAYRFVEEYDQLLSKHIDYRAEQTVQLRGEHTAVVARGVARMDGEQVHIG